MASNPKPLSFADVPVGTYFTWDPCGCRLKVAYRTTDSRSDRGNNVILELIAPCQDCDGKSRMLQRAPYLSDFACTSTGRPYPRAMSSRFKGTIDYLVTELAK